MNTNIVVIAGNLTREPELKFTKTGTPIATFSIANNQRKQVNDEWVDDVSYFNFIVWGDKGEKYASRFNKGTSLLVEGKLKQQRWETDAGKRSKVEIVAYKVTPTEKKPAHHEQQPEEPTQPVDDDSVPF